MNLVERHGPLVRAAHGGDPAALDQLLRLCQPDLRRYARRACLADDVDDAVQESLLILARSIGTVRVLAALSGWLFQVVKRTCLNLRRRLDGTEPLDEEVVARWLAVRDSALLRAELVAALESLPADYREVILLRDFAGMSIAEIAAALQVSQAAVKSRLHRARQLAREYLVDAQ